MKQTVYIDLREFAAEKFFAVLDCMDSNKNPTHHTGGSPVRFPFATAVENGVKELVCVVVLS
ncbi:hypothetical protein QQP08_014021, partial [Theobroma cacao]